MGATKHDHEELEARPKKETIIIEEEFK